MISYAQETGTFIITKCKMGVVKGVVYMLFNSRVPLLTFLGQHPCSKVFVKFTHALNMYEFLTIFVIFVEFLESKISLLSFIRKCYFFITPHPFLYICFVPTLYILYTSLYVVFFLELITDE